LLQRGLARGLRPRRRGARNEWPMAVSSLPPPASATRRFRRRVHSLPQSNCSQDGCATTMQSERLRFKGGRMPARESRQDACATTLPCRVAILAARGSGSGRGRMQQGAPCGAPWMRSRKLALTRCRRSAARPGCWCRARCCPCRTRCCRSRTSPCTGWPAGRAPQSTAGCRRARRCSRRCRCSHRG